MRILHKVARLPAVEMSIRSRTRREALKAVGVVGASSLLPGAAHAQERLPLTIADREIEVVVSPVSARTVRLTLGTPGQSVPMDGALIRDNWAAPVARWRELSAAAHARAGDVLVDASADTTAVTLLVRRGGTTVQRLSVDRAT